MGVTSDKPYSVGKVKNGSSKITKNYQKLMELIVLSFYWDHKKVWKQFPGFRIETKTYQKCLLNANI